ncbi:DUF11 domain-containing protein [Deinococcus antarcticus]|uniref:DUF11 domain-containing protein n=1 Tax=Deinococcus antarcticus TaxID=1298767 RepID=A0ABV8A981_9DEIO
MTSGGQTSATSNRVVTVVQGVCAVSITPNGQDSVFAMGGDQVSFGFTITNAGNQAYTLPISATGSGLTPAPEVVLYLDTNGNGVVDAGETPVSSVNLPADGMAKVVARVQVATGTQGQALVNLVASCGNGGDQATATATVQVSPPPTLNVTKSFTPALVKPGTETTVNVSTTNSSTYASREVILTDPLAEEVAQGLVFVPGSASSNIGVIEYTADGSTWSVTAPNVVMGIRVRVDALAPAASINLTFKMRAEEKADGKKILNVATASSSGQSVSGQATADVRYLPGVAIGPVGKPLAPEGTPEDSQTRPFAVVGKELCFDHTVQNTGDVKDNFRITITFPAGAATTTLYGADGKALVQPIALNPNETALVRVCYTPTQASPIDARITVNGDRGTSNTTRDLVTDVQSGLPELKKSYVATSVDLQNQPITLKDGATVAVGDTVTYTLSVKNPYTRALTNVQVSDPIPAHVNFVSASDSGVRSGVQGEEVVTWNLGTLQPGETRTLTIVTKVSDRSVDGENLKNIFNMTSTELGTAPLPSNEVNTPVWNAQLIINKDVSSKLVVYGDRLTYTLRIRNASATTAIESATLTDVPMKGLLYLPGTATLDGKPLADPTIMNGVMQWNVGSIPASGEIVVTYDMRVTPEASGDLLNIATVTGVGAGGAAKAIASNRAQATAKLDPLKFAPLADLIGIVFVDRNRNGLFEAGLDTPVERARVILAGGRLVLTDTKGRYHFANVPTGTWALRLDPNTTPYPPLQKPQEGGLDGTQTVHVRGLTSVDFPLAPLGGDITAIRRTTLTMGDVKVEKAVYAVKDGYVVTIKITTPGALTDFHMEDPLPGGATLKEGRNTLSTNLSAGETNLTYHFDWTGAPNAATTDPIVSWRY